MTVEPEPHQVDATQREVAVEALLLRHVADFGVAPPRRPPVDRDPAGGQRLQPEQDPDQAGLAGAVRTKHSEHLAARHLEVDVLPQHPVAEAQRRTTQRYGRLLSLATEGRQQRTVLGSCQAWKSGTSAATSRRLQRPVRLR